jgi:hypothetical protein
MEAEKFLKTLKEAIPVGVRPQMKGEWVQICDALQLPSAGSVAEMMESVYTEKGIMLEALRIGREAERKHKMETGAEGGNVSVLKKLLNVITESNENTNAMLQHSVVIDEKRHQAEVE